MCFDWKSLLARALTLPLCGITAKALRHAPHTLVAALRSVLIHFTLIQWALEKTFVCVAKLYLGN